MRDGREPEASGQPDATAAATPGPGSPTLGLGLESPAVESAPALSPVAETEAAPSAPADSGPVEMGAPESEAVLHRPPAESGVADTGAAGNGVAGNGVAVDGAEALSAAIGAAPEAEDKGRRAKRGLRRFIPAPVLHIGQVLIIALIIEYLVLPQIAGTRDALKTLTHVDPLWLLLGVGLECLSIAAYAQLTRSVLPSETDPGFFRVLRIQLTTLAISHCVPGGSVAGSTLGYRLLTGSGVRRADVGFALATEGLGSAVILNVIFWIALVVSIPVWGISPLYLTAALIGAVLIGGFIGLVVLFSRAEQLADGVIRRISRRLPLVDEDAVHELFVRLGVRLKTLGHERSILARAVLWASANWLLDAASLYVFVGAFGHWVNPDGLLVSYGLAYVLAAIPLTPGGLGVVEATLTLTLVGFNTTRAIATFGVVAYRLINFWLPIPVGGLAYLSLQVDSGVAPYGGRVGWLKIQLEGLRGIWRRAAQGRSAEDIETDGQAAAVTVTGGGPAAAPARQG
jgi:uncharacterized protein (TIRG00374 family)